MSVVQDIVTKKVFLAHPKNHSNPKTRDSWLGTQNWMVILDPDAVAAQLESATKMFAEAKNSGKEILVICEKEMYKENVEKLAEKSHSEHCSGASKVTSNGHIEFTASSKTMVSAGETSNCLQPFKNTSGCGLPFTTLFPSTITPNIL